MSEVRNRAILEKAIVKWQAGDGGAIFDLLADDVHWTVIGSTPISGVYHRKQDFVDRALKPLGVRLKGGITPEVVDVIVEGDKVALLWNGTGEMIDGSAYRNQYSWVMRFEDGKVKEGTAYLDTELVGQLMQLPQPD